MGKILKLEVAHSSKKRFREDDVDFASVATIFMDEVYTDFANLIRMKLVNNNIAPTKESLNYLCEEIDDLMGDMTVSELLKETERQNKRALLEYDKNKT